MTSQINDLLSKQKFYFIESTEIKDFIESQPYTDNNYWNLEHTLGMNCVFNDEDIDKLVGDLS